MTSIDLTRRVAALEPAERNRPGSSRQRRHADREQLLERLQNICAILPVFAQEVASARRQAAELRVQNRSLVAEVRRLQRTREDHAKEW